MPTHQFTLSPLQHDSLYEWFESHPCNEVAKRAHLQQLSVQFTMRNGAAPLVTATCSACLTLFRAPE